MDLDVTSTKSNKCSRCGNSGFICENGLCGRCDNVVFGKGGFK